MKTTALFLAALAAVSAAGVRAEVITFDGLTGGNGSAFTTYTEAGFTVTPTTGSWYQGTSFGDPTPSLVSGGVFGGPADNSITITNGGQFTFTSIDFAGSTTSDADYTFTGTLGGSNVFTVTGVEPPPQVFSTILSGVSGDIIDTLVIETDLVSNDANQSVNLDNIVVNSSATPEPGTMGLIAAGLTLLGFIKRRS